MKECVYGWYPPARELYGAKPMCDTDCVYGQQYGSSRGVSSVTPTTLVPEMTNIPPFRRQLTPSTVWPQTKNVSQASDRIARSASAKYPTQVSRNEKSGVPRPKSAVTARESLRIDGRSACGSARPASVVRPVSQDSLRVDGHSTVAAKAWPFTPTKPSSSSSSQKLWATKVAETPIFPGPKSPASPAGHRSASDSAISCSHSKSRVQSARPHRPNTATHPHRNIKSAEPRSRCSPVVVKEPEVTAAIDEEKLFDGEKEEDEEEEELGVDEPLDYDEQLTRCGWRMEIPGDPLRLKRACLHKKPLYYQVCRLQDQIAPNPPKTFKASPETFFSNTLPRRPMTFTIHKEFASEHLCAKRNEDLKKQGPGYKYRQNFFSFLY